VLAGRDCRCGRQGQHHSESHNGEYGGSHF
jgi:hypothetical protein